MTQKLFDEEEGLTAQTPFTNPGSNLFSNPINSESKNFRHSSGSRLSCSTIGARPRGSVLTVTLEVAIKAGTADAENLRRAQTVAVAHLQNFLNVDFAHLVER
jgi:hypothetical protein